MIRALGSRPWLFIVGQSPLGHQGSLGPSPGCLTFCGRPRPRRPGQGSGRAHCAGFCRAGFCATKARTPRRCTGGQQRPEGAEPTLRCRGARQVREQRATTPATATRSRRGTALPHPQRRQVPRDDPRLKLVLEGSGITTAFPLKAQAVRDDTPIGRMIAGQVRRATCVRRRAGTRPTSSPATLLRCSREGREK